MKKIFKYFLEITDVQEIQIPEDSGMICAKNQNEKLVMWAIVEDENPLEFVTIRIVGTGHPLPKDKSFQYIDTAQFSEGRLVWHVFIERK